mmetsp:Transcript_23577/g.20939  ORF Transcript_23577/g.20939 Transcript_23577/m.20939 type:complete len:95 (-) Transcript_23577:499-783(-)
MDKKKRSNLKGNPHPFVQSKPYHQRMRDFEEKALEMEKQRGRIPNATIPKDGGIGKKRRDYNFNQYIPDFNSYDADSDLQEMKRIELMLSRLQK